MIRITGGEFKGRTLKVPGSGTRPTHSLLRQALLNSIQFKIQDVHALDLYSGSGAIGFEMLSRGAGRISFVEMNRNAARCIQSNALALQVGPRIKIYSESVEKAAEQLLKLHLETQAPAFPVIIADPPYGEGHEDYLLSRFPWPVLLADGGGLSIEWSRQRTAKEVLLDSLVRDGYQLVKVREKNYGETTLTTYEKSHLSRFV